MYRQSLRSGLLPFSMALVIAVTGCGSATTSSGPSGPAGTQVVTFWETDQALVQPYTNLITEFEAANPNIKVNLELVPWSDLQTKLQTGIATGGLPDVSFIGNDAVAQYQHLGALAPLDQYIDEESSRVGGDITKDFWPGDFGYYHLGGHWYGYPAFEETRALFYRTDLFKNAGLNPLNPPQTWDEMKADAKALTTNGVFGWGLSMATDLDDATFMNIYLSYGARMLNQGKCGFDTPEFKQALDYYVSIYKEGLTPPDATTWTYDQFVASREKGTTAMWIDGPWSWTSLQQDTPDLIKNIAVAPIPTGPKGRFAFLGGVPMVLWNASKVKDAAAKWIVFANSPQHAGDIARADGVFPPRQSMISQDPWNQYPYTVFLGQMNRAFAYQYPDEEIPQMGALEVSAFQSAIQAVALGTKSVDEGTVMLCDTINKALSQ